MSTTQELRRMLVREIRKDRPSFSLLRQLTSALQESLAQQRKLSVDDVDGPNESYGSNITMVIKNSGSADATVNSVFLNDVPCLTANYGSTAAPVGAWGVSFATTGVSLAAGQSSEVYVLIDVGYLSLSSGTTVNVKLHSAGGMDYIKLIRLP